MSVKTIKLNWHFKRFFFFFAKQPVSLRWVISLHKFEFCMKLLQWIIKIEISNCFWKQSQYNFMWKRISTRSNFVRVYFSPLGWWKTNTFYYNVCTDASPFNTETDNWKTTKWKNVRSITSETILLCYHFNFTVNTNTQWRIQNMTWGNSLIKLSWIKQALWKKERKMLHISCCCKEYTIIIVMIDG